MSLSHTRQNFPGLVEAGGLEQGWEQNFGTRCFSLASTCHSFPTHSREA